MTHLRVGKGHFHMSEEAKMGILSFRIDSELRAGAEAAAAKERRRLSDFIRLVIAEGVERRAADRGRTAAA